MFKLKYFLALSCLISTTTALAESTVTMNFTAENGVGESAGTVMIRETPYGLLFSPHLHNLTPGIHGFHVHQNASCDKNGMSAGGHFDPTNSGKHLGPYDNNGHLGDLAILVVNADGTATLPVLAPRIHSVEEIKQHALMIHNGSDNYSDIPDKLGGGGGRMVCGIIK